MNIGERYKFKLENNYEEAVGSVYPLKIVIDSFYNDEKFGAIVSFKNAENMQFNLDEFNGCPVDRFNQLYELDREEKQ